MQSLAITLAPYLGLQPTHLWPISWDSAPFLTTLFCLLVSSLCYFFYQEHGNTTVFEAALEKRRKSKHKMMKNVIFLENGRLSQVNKKKTTNNEKKHLQSVDDIDHDEPPTAQYLFDIIFEEVEEEPVTVCLGIDCMDPWYLRVLTLLKRRAQAEIEEATNKTRRAQTLGLGLQTDQLILDYQDGEKLAQILEFTREKVLEYFKHQVDQPTPTIAIDGIAVARFDATYIQAGQELRVNMGSVAEATKVLSEVHASQKRAMSYIMDIMRPVLPTYCLGLLFMIMGRAFEAPLWAQSMPAYKASVAMINPSAAEGEFGHGAQVFQDAMGHLLVFGVGFLFSRPIDIMASALADRASEDFSQPLRHAVMSAIMKQDTEYFDFNTASVLQQRLNKDTNELVKNLLFLPRMTLQNVFRVLQRTITLWFVAPQMMWACLSFNVPLFSLIILATARPLRKLLGKRDRGNQNAEADTLELLQNIKTVRQFSMEVQERDTYSTSNMSRSVFESRIRVMESLTHTFRHFAHMTGEVYVIYTALSLAVAGDATASDAIVACTVGMWLQHDMKNLLENIPKLLKITKPLHRVASLLAVKPRIEQDPDSDTNSLLRPTDGFVGHIEFKNVTFSYPTERQKQVLNGLSFTAKPGEKVALVGKAGCGKSTAMDLMQRFYQRNSGQIKIDGQPIENYDTTFLRRHMGVVSQTSVLFSRSIYENIVYGMEHPPGPESPRFREVCDKAQAWEFIRKFPNKQYTLVGEKGIKLSGGQTQRVAIARVIMRQPTFIFLDEATSALDAINEKAVQAALDEMLQRFNGVALVVAHRLTTICNCDKIVVLGDDGVKVEEGTHEDLLAVPKQCTEDGQPLVGPGLYHTLWDTQQVEGKEAGRETALLVEQLGVKDKLITGLQLELAQFRSMHRPIDKCISTCGLTTPHMHNELLPWSPHHDSKDNETLSSSICTPFLRRTRSC